MQRNRAIYKITPAFAGELKTRMLNWAQQFSILVFLDNNYYPTQYSGYECLLAAGGFHIIDNTTTDPLQQLQLAHEIKKDWLFGHICYDYKNILEPNLSTRHSTINYYPQLQFFIPETVCYINRELDTLTIETVHSPESMYNDIMRSASVIDTATLPQITFIQTTHKEEYIDTVNKLRTHIANGDCYEINYCSGGFAENAQIDPLTAFHALNTLSPAPFAAYFRLQDNYLLCASPERYLRKEGTKILSQPIKGTARRDADPQKDAAIKDALKNDIKERAENIMIVDLVRNDLARCCEVGSVQVDELFGVYSFPQVHQLISTVSGKLGGGASLTDAIRTSFPMGSMTGAPKYKVMQLIDQYEYAGRGLFSGTIGYITPTGDFDFNVIIRSMFYNADTCYLSYQTGGAITFDSDAEREWEEMRLKAWALERVFQKNTI